MILSVAKGVEDAGAAKKLCPQALSPGAERKQLLDQSFHGAIAEAPHRLAFAAIEGKQKMVYPTDLEVSVVQTHGNAGAENRRHGGAFGGNKDLPGMKIKFCPLSRYYLRCRSS